jgi:hypothetical protein
LEAGTVARQDEALMKPWLQTAAFGAALLLAACGIGPGLTGNDTGGVISWSPENHLYAREMAAAHCAKYNKNARITSVRARYGDYIAFVCRFDRRYDPALPPGSW